MANGNGDRQSLTVVLGVIGLLATVTGGSLAFHARVMADVHGIVAGELKHVVTREELSNQRRVMAEVETQRHLILLRRLDQLDYQLKELRRTR